MWIINSSPCSTIFYLPISVYIMIYQNWIMKYLHYVELNAVYRLIINIPNVFAKIQLKTKDASSFEVCLVIRIQYLVCGLKKEVTEPKLGYFITAIHLMWCFKKYFDFPSVYSVQKDIKGWSKYIHHLWR